MSKRVVLRFRDLVTENDATIEEHQALIRQHGEVCWGWWMRQHETPPRHVFAEMAKAIEEKGNIEIFLFDAGQLRLFEARVTKVYSAPQDLYIASPHPHLTPGYYQRGKYPAWFMLNSITPVEFTDLKLAYDDFPTEPSLAHERENIKGQHIASLDKLKSFDVTLWVVLKD